MQMPNPFLNLPNQPQNHQNIAQFGARNQPNQFYGQGQLSNNQQPGFYGSQPQNIQNNPFSNSMQPQNNNIFGTQQPNKNNPFQTQNQFGGRQQ